MFHLIKKDVLIQKRALKLSVLLMLFFTATLSSLGSIGIVVGIFAITYQLVLGASALEEKNNSDVILISLPIKRNTIVLSKYVSVYVYAAFAMAGFYLVYLMVNLLNIPLRIHLRGQLFLVALIAVTFFSCICLPLTFKYGYTKAKMPNLVIFLLFVFGGTGIVNYLRSSNQTLLSQAVATFLSTRSCLEISLAVAGGLALVLVFSYFTSLFFYKKREW